MEWIRLDCDIFRDPDVASLDSAQFVLFVWGLCYAGEQETDGFVPTAIARSCPWSKRTASKALVACGLWDDVAGGFQIRNWSKKQPSAGRLDHVRRQAVRRMSLNRDSAQVALIRARDGDHCRYCGVEVNWKDRRGPTGGTYDHVDPAGTNDLSNVVVACRGCNSAKGARSVAEAGLTLREPGSGSNPNLTGPDLYGTKTLDLDLPNFTGQVGLEGGPGETGPLRGNQDPGPDPAADLDRNVAVIGEFTPVLGDRLAFEWSKIRRSGGHRWSTVVPQTFTDQAIAFGHEAVVTAIEHLATMDPGALADVDRPRAYVIAAIEDAAKNAPKSIGNGADPRSKSTQNRSETEAKTNAKRRGNRDGSRTSDGPVRHASRTA